VKAAANGYHSQLRVALSDGITPSCFSALLALCRQEEPEIEIRLSEVPLSQQIKGLLDDAYDLGFARADEVGDGVFAEPAWSDPLVVAVPDRHPLLSYKRIPLEEVLRYPLVLGDPHACEGYVRQIDRLLRHADREPLVAGRVATITVMMAMVAAGCALGLAGASQFTASRERGVIARPLAGLSPKLTTYLLRPDEEPSEIVTRFIECVHAVEALGSDQPNVPEETES